jgi:ABC-2 type transport system ATP-binding protein
VTEAVRVVGLTRRFGDFTAVDNISFTISTGEIFGFLGPNGAGKTTTIKMLTGLVTPTSGSASVAGHDVVHDTAEVKRHIGYMSQRFSLYADLRVGENIAFFAGLYGVGGERLERRRAWILDMAGLRDQAGRTTGDLPLGWRQRLALGCAVLHEPPVLFLDEPTSGVDPGARRAFWDLIREMADAGTTVLVSTHYMEEAEYCDRLALMNRGQLIALDRPAALHAAMTQPIVEVRATDPMRAMAALQQAPGVLDAALHGRAVRAVLEDAAAGSRAVNTALIEAGLSGAALRVVEPSLEDVFTHLVTRQGLPEEAVAP